MFNLTRYAFASLILGFLIALAVLMTPAAATDCDQDDGNCEPGQGQESPIDQDPIDQDPVDPVPDEPYCPEDNNGRDQPSPECS